MNHNITFGRSFRALALFVLGLTAAPIQAATVHNEAINGDLTNFVEVAPWTTPGTPLGVLSAGANIVVGTYTGVTPRDSDVLTFEIPSGHQLDSIDLVYDIISGSPGGGSYMAIQQGSELGTGMATVGSNLSNALVNASGDLLAKFASGPAFGGTGLVAPLLAGQYTLGFHETGDATIGYSLAFNVSQVPEPSTFAVATIGLVLSVSCLRHHSES
jgi:hypothetical protein